MARGVSREQSVERLPERGGEADRAERRNAVPGGRPGRRVRWGRERAAPHGGACVHGRDGNAHRPEHGPEGRYPTGAAGDESA